ncbi:retropepsin-like aspartic protease family protein [Alkalinema pantanalense CENA528]|uniref:retropepsin-like aspartic protease family protein n=1 Tax=Alkalinema pantanalense TaxID=1620705 RepID=UPI003D700B68
MKRPCFRFLPAVLLELGLTTGFATVIGLQSTAIAQNTCYMVTASGQRVSLGSLCGEEPPEKAGKTPKDGIYRVKIKRRLASTPVIDVMFNGKPFEMILDTGASSTLITRDMANALRLKPIGFRKVIIADGSVVQFPVSSIGSVSTGGLTTKNLEVTIADKADVGLLGHDFFGRYDVKIKRNSIEFHPQSN